ncbi:MAG: hypothetical protein Q8P67_19015, partial [archaeon]|nr:hypothetical protein [archaeon]
PEECADPFVVWQIASCMFVALFGGTVLLLIPLNDNRFLPFVARLTWRGMGLIVLTGIFNAFNGIFVAISAPVDRTPPVISSTFPNISFILMIFLIWWMHRRHWLPLPKIAAGDFWTLEFVLFALMYVLCTYCTVVATNEQAALGGQVYWWIIFSLGIIFSYLSNQLQEIFFKTEEFDGSINSMTNYLFSTLIAMLVFSLLGTFIDCMMRLYFHFSFDFF